MTTEEVDSVFGALEDLQVRYQEIRSNADILAARFQTLELRKRVAALAWGGQIFMRKVQFTVPASVAEEWSALVGTCKQKGIVCG